MSKLNWIWQSWLFYEHVFLLYNNMEKLLARKLSHPLKSIPISMSIFTNKIKNFRSSFFPFLRLNDSDNNILNFNLFIFFYDARARFFPLAHKNFYKVRVLRFIFRSNTSEEIGFANELWESEHCQRPVKTFASLHIPINVRCRFSFECVVYKFTFFCYFCATVS